MSRKNLLSDAYFPGLANRLIFVRKSIVKCSLDEMGKRLGVSGATVSRYESGQIHLPEDRLRQYAEISGKPIDWFLYGESQPPAQTAAGPAFDSSLLRQVIVGVELGLARLGLGLPPAKKADLIVLLYDHYAKTQHQPDDQTIDRYLRLVA